MKPIEDVLKSVTNKKLLAVYSHPDDESVMAGGIIQRAILLGFEVTVLVLTEGGRGKIFGGGKGRSVYEIRREEMANAMGRLGVTDWVMWKFEDGRLRKRQAWRERISRFILETNPGIIVSFDLSGITGHPDHIVTALEVLRTARKMKATKLLWTSFSGDIVRKMVKPEVLKYMQKPRYELALTLTESTKKWRAVFDHKSQNLGNYVGWPWWRLVLTDPKEWYSEVDIGKKYKYRFVKFRV